MKFKESSPRLRGQAVAATVLIGIWVAFGAIGCSSNGLHLPASMWPFKGKAAGTGGTAGSDVAAAAPYVPPPPAPVNGEMVDSVIASVDGTPITSHDVASFDSSELARQSGGADLPTDPNAKLKALITQQLMQVEASKYASKVDDADVDRYIEGIEQQHSLTEEQLRAQLQKQSVSYATFREKIRKQVQATEMFRREVRDKISISDADIDAYYKDHQDEFTIADEKYQLAQILIAASASASPTEVAAAQAKAEDVRRQAAKGKDFADLARQYSDDDSKSKGGELGVFSPRDLNDYILAGIKDAKPGDVSKVIRTKYGFHVVKVEQHQVPGLAPFADVRGSIREKLQADRSKDDMQRWMDHDLVKDHYVETTP
jgi:peptidyl-prolyl cis-trans isomerase SurA